MRPYQERGEHVRYINRDLSWIEFNRRVLNEAEDAGVPLLERVKFLAIVTSNLDEFMSVRVSGAKQQINAGIGKRDFTGYTPQALFRRLMKRSEELVAEQYRTYRDIVRALAKEKILFPSYRELNGTQKKRMDEYFYDIVLPVLTPMAVDQSRPFPLVHSLGLYLSVVLRKEGSGGEAYFAIVQVPSILPRIVPVPGRRRGKKEEFLLLEDLIKQHIHSLFNGYTPVGVHAFRLTRNSDLELNEETAEDLLEEVEKELRRRRWGVPVRLEVDKGMDGFALDMLKEEFEITDHIFTVDGPIDLSCFLKLPAMLSGREHLRYPPLEPRYPDEWSDDEEEDWYAALRAKDVLLYHPYESFDAVLDLIEQAAQDPHVLAIKMTLYRVGGNPPLIQSLAKAAEAGKQVTIVVELRARFDEERNIAWAKQLEKAGRHVVYGLVGLKTHAKVTLIVRQEQNRLRRYVHIGTGNYNENTARLYTDLGLLTAHPVIGEDASALFNEITGYSAPHDWKAISVAPNDLQEKLLALIEREAKHAQAGKSARLIVKVNSLSNQEMIDALYAASASGARVDLIVRGVCCLRPGVAGLSDNIRVISIIDRFLEHSRIFYFENDGDPEVYLSSSDWMTRNLKRRIELMCPVYAAPLKKTVIGILDWYLRDNVKARVLRPNGSYAPAGGGDEAFRAQFAFMDVASWKREEAPSRPKPDEDPTPS